MQGNRFVYAAVAVALLGLPSAALAQEQSGDWNRDAHATRQSDRSPDARRTNARRYDDNRDDRNPSDRRDRDDRSASDRRDRNDRRDADDRRDRDRAGDGRSYGGYDRNARSGRLNGEVSSFGGFDMTLRNGQQVRLHQGTIIDPTGTTLRPGMRLAISGHGNSDGSYEADRIVVIGDNGRY